MIVMTDFMICLIVVLIAMQCITVHPTLPPPSYYGRTKKKINL